MTDIFLLLFDGFLHTTEEVLKGFLPIVIIFLVLRFLGLKVSKRDFRRIISGFIIAFVGLVLFMQGVFIAFLPIGSHLGAALALLENKWLFIALGFLMGFLVAFAEPAVHVMIAQVEEITSGAIKSQIMLVAISLGVAIAVALAMARLLWGISLWLIILPGYLGVFILSRFVREDFLAMAVDNGGVATGPLCSTFILALSVAIASAIPGRDPLLDGFGIVALVALAPILTTMLLSFLYKARKV